MQLGASKVFGSAPDWEICLPVAKAEIQSPKLGKISLATVHRFEVALLTFTDALKLPGSCGLHSIGIHERSRRSPSHRAVIEGHVFRAVHQHADGPNDFYSWARWLSWSAA